MYLNPLPVLALIVVTALAACTAGSDKAEPAASSGAGVVNLYTARHYDSDFNRLAHLSSPVGKSSLACPDWEAGIASLPR